MDLTYMVRGADGKEYGPATLDRLTEWIKEGRVPAGQEIRRSDMEYWSKAGEFEELQTSFTGAAGTASGGTARTAVGGAGTATTADSAALLARVKSGGSWFYWVAGLSLINSVVALTGSSWGFYFALGITQLFDAFGAQMGEMGKFVAFGLDLLAAGIFVLFGIFAVKGQTWAFIVGGVLFAMDALIFVLAKAWIGVGLHAFVLYCLFNGFAAARQLKAS